MSARDGKPLSGLFFCPREGDDKNWQRAESKEQRAKSKEQRAKSKEQRAIDADF
jgi:uncharacterized Zn finger protein (UPF0148 family)